MADDRQLRDITFWTLGSLCGSTWGKAGAIAPFLLVLLLAMPFIVNGLDLLVLGEAEAFHMGVAVERLKRAAIVLVAAAAGAAVAFAGIIGFVGIVVPHLLRLALGPGHRVSCCRRRYASARSCCSPPTPWRACWSRRRSCRSASSPRSSARRSSWCC